MLKIDDIKKLHQKKYRNEFGYFLVEGEHLILELEKAAQQNPTLQKSELFITEEYSGFSTRFRKNTVTAKQMTQLSDTTSPQGIIAVVPFGSLIPSESNNVKRAIYLHEVQDPGNLGTILRTLAWFGNFQCLLSPNAVDPYNPKVVRSSMGAIFHVPLELDVPIDSLTTRFSKIACLDMNGASLSDASFKNFDCYLFGNEARGLPQTLLNALNPMAFTIKGCGKIDSLNLASAVNMCIYELMR